MRNKTLRAATVALTSTALLFGASPAFANAGNQLANSPTQGAETAIEQHSDADLLKLLLDGSGPIAETNPELVEKLGFTADRERINPDIIDDHVQKYLDFNPSFNEDIASDLTSGNPQVVEEALHQFGHTYQAFLVDEYDLDLEAEAPIQAQGCDGHACVQLIAVAVGAVYATVAAVTFVAAVAAVTYLMDENPETDGIERKETIADLTRAFSQ